MISSSVLKMLEEWSALNCIEIDGVWYVPGQECAEICMDAAFQQVSYIAGICGAFFGLSAVFFLSFFVVYDVLKMRRKRRKESE